MCVQHKSALSEILLVNMFIHLFNILFSTSTFMFMMKYKTENKRFDKSMFFSFFKK